MSDVLVLTCVHCGEQVRPAGFTSGLIFEHLEEAHGIDGHFTHCVYCGADCELDADEREHHRDCPSVTGLHPVFPFELGARGPNDPYAHGMRCSGCGAEFQIGDVYTYRQLEEDVEPFGLEPTPILTPVCIGCAALDAPLQAFEDGP